MREGSQSWGSLPAWLWVVGMTAVYKLDQATENTKVICATNLRLVPLDNSFSFCVPKDFSSANWRQECLISTSEKCFHQHIT